MNMVVKYRIILSGIYPNCKSNPKEAKKANNETVEKLSAMRHLLGTISHKLHRMLLEGMLDISIWAESDWASF